MTTGPRADAARWLLTLAVTALGLLVSAAIGTSGTTTLIPQFAAVAVLALVLGRVHGLASLAAGFLVTFLLVMDPALEPAARGQGDVARLVLFVVLGLGVIWLADRYRRGRAETEERLRDLARGARRFQAAQEVSPDPFTILSAVRGEDGAIADFRWEYANEAAAEALRTPVDALVGARLLEVLPGNRGAGLFDAYAEVTRTGEPFSDELWYDADGIRGWFQSTTVRLDDGVAVAFRDVTARRWVHERERLLADAGVTLDTELGVEARMRALADLIADRVAAACQITFVAGGVASEVAAGDAAAEGERLVLPMAARGHGLGRVTLTGLRPPADETLARVLTARAALAVDNARLHEESEAAVGRTRLLADAGLALTAAFDASRPLDPFAQALVPRMADWCCLELLHRGRLRVATAAHRDPSRGDALRERCAQAPGNGTCGSAAVVRTGRAELHERLTDDDLRIAADGDEHYLALLREDPPLSAMVVPLVARGRVLGALTLAISEPGGRSFTATDLELAEELGRRAALAVDNVRLHQGQRTIAATLQRALLPPEMPVPVGAAIAARYLPAGEGIEVGGDFYDALPLGEDRWLLAAGDVCGKGAEAAALTAMARFTMRALAPATDGPARLVSALNDAILHQMPGNTRFLTLVAAELAPCPEGLRVRTCCAGHPHPLIVRRDGRTEWGGTDAGLVGLFPGLPTAERTHVLEPGDALVLYTDGVTEARDEDGMLGDEGLLDLVAPGLDAETLAGRIVDGVMARADETRRDDVAVVVVRAEHHAMTTRREALTEGGVAR